MNLCIHSFFDFFLASSYAYPTFKLSNTVAIVVSKTAAKDQKQGPVSRKSPPLP